MKKPYISELDIKKAVKKVLSEEDRLPIEDFEYEMDDSTYDDIYEHQGPVRHFRGSIYYDGYVPETDDVEYDRKVAQKLLDYERSKLGSAETYVGGVGFKNRGNLINPFDNMDF